MDKLIQLLGHFTSSPTELAFDTFSFIPSDYSKLCRSYYSPLLIALMAHYLCLRKHLEKNIHGSSWAEYMLPLPVLLLLIVSTRGRTAKFWYSLYFIFSCSIYWSYDDFPIALILLISYYLVIFSDCG